MSQTKDLNFQIIGIEDKPVIEEVTRKYDPYSDFNFVSLFSWGVNRSSSYALVDGSLVIRLRDYMDKGFIYSVLGDRPAPAADAVFGLTDAGRLELVPEVTADRLEGYGREHQRDEDDYHYELDALLAMDGAGYRHFRRSLSNFATKNPDLAAATRLVPHDDEDAKNQLLDLAKAWRLHKNRPFSEASSEYFAIRKALRHSRELNLHILGVYDREKIIGFTISERIGDWAVLHFEKSSGDYPSLGSHVKLETFKYLNGAGCLKLNYEQDLGIEGLRNTKMSLCPDGFLRKFIVSKPEQG